MEVQLQLELISDDTLNRNGCLKRPWERGALLENRVPGLTVVLAVWGFKGSNYIELKMAGIPEGNAAML